MTRSLPLGLALCLACSLVLGCTDPGDGGTDPVADGTTDGEHAGDEDLTLDERRRMRVERGRAIFNRYNCRSCHALGGLGGSNAPALDGVVPKYTELEGSREAALAFIRNHLDDPDAYPGVEKEDYPFVNMPDFPFAEGEIDALVAFLAAEPADEEEPGEEEDAGDGA